MRAAARRRRRLVRPPRLPRAAEVDPPLNAVVGFTNMVLRLWEAEQPRAVLVGWDTLDAPTYRHEAFAGLPVRPRVRRLAARAARPAARARRRDRLRERARRRATRPTTSSRPRRATTSGRSSSPPSRSRRVPARARRVTILQPAPRRLRARADRPRRGARALRRRARAGARLHRAPRRPVRQDSGRARRRREDGRDAAAAVRLARGGARGTAASPPRPTTLRLYRRIATMDAAAPLPALPDAEPDWARAAALAREWGLGQARRAAGGASSS